MKNSLKIFGLSVILSIASISAFADSSAKNYVESEDIIISEGKIYLQTEEDNLEPLSALYSDEKGLYILTPIIQTKVLSKKLCTHFVSLRLVMSA